MHACRGHPAAQPVTRPTRSGSGADHDFFAIAKPGALRGPRAPGAPLRNGAIVILSSSPALRLLLDHPSRARALGVTPSRFQTVMLPSCALTSKRINVWGLVYLNSCTTPSRSDLILVIEHRKGVVRHRRATHRDQSTADQYDRETLSHDASSHAGTKCFEHTATPLRTLGSAAHLSLLVAGLQSPLFCRWKAFLRVGYSVLPCCQGPAQAIRSTSASAIAIP